jgi:hypothetical protein
MDRAKKTEGTAVEVVVAPEIAVMNLVEIDALEAVRRGNVDLVIARDDFQTLLETTGKDLEEIVVRLLLEIQEIDDTIDAVDLEDLLVGCSFVYVRTDLDINTNDS